MSVGALPDRTAAGLIAVARHPAGAEAIRAVLDSAPNGMLVLDEQGRVLYQNRHLAKLMGADASVDDALALFARRDRPRIAQRMHDAQAEDPSTRTMTEPLEADLARREPRGALLPVELVITPFDAGGRRLVSLAIMDVSARRALERELLARNAELQQFTSIASHDLQEPLRMIVNYCELLDARAGPALDERSRLYLGHAVAGSKRLQTLIDGLLDYARLGRTALKPRPMELREVAQAALADLRGALERSNGVVEIDPLPRAAVDPTLMQQVFQNLLANAIKFHAGAPPRVHVSARESAGAIQVFVDDEGIGIPAGQEERIFRMFQRVHARASFEGNGIGLATSRRIVEAHGGTLHAQARAGGGSRFTITLPNTTEEP